jgi:hypothetical protein
MTTGSEDKIGVSQKKGNINTHVCRYIGHHNEIYFSKIIFRLLNTQSRRKKSIVSILTSNFVHQRYFAKQYCFKNTALPLSHNSKSSIWGFRNVAYKNNTHIHTYQYIYTYMHTYIRTYLHTYMV